MYIRHQYLQQVPVLIPAVESCEAYCNECGTGVWATGAGTAAGAIAGASTAFAAAFGAETGAAGGATAGVEGTDRNFVASHFPMKVCTFR